MDEKQNIEWKQNWRDDYLKWVCGFTNSQGGKIYIGKNDKGNVSGLDNYQKLMMEDLPNKIRDLLGIFVEVNLHEENEKRYIEIIVPKYQVPISYRGKYYIRAGSTIQELNPKLSLTNDNFGFNMEGDYFRIANS